MKKQSEKDDQTKKIAAEAAGKEVNLKEFLSCFYSEDETVFIRLFADKKDKDLPAQEFFPRLNKIDEFIPKLKVLNNQGYGVFFSVNGERVDKDVTKIRAQFFECDDISIEQQLENIKTFPLQPSIIVRTRKSLHVYFLIENGKVEAFRTIQKKLAQQFHGDKTVVNESRVMRILGYNHCKQEPFMVECMEFNPQLIYTQEQLESYLPELQDTLPKETKAEYNKGTREQLDFLVDNCDFIKHCKEHAAFLPEIDWYSMVTNLAHFEGGKEKIHELSNCYPRYSEFETDQKIEHFLNSGTAPMNCKIIAEKGYVCPCIGSCSCRSPAGLPFSNKISFKNPEWYVSLKNGLKKFMPGVLAGFLAENFKSIYVGERFYIFKEGYYQESLDYEVQKIIQYHLIITEAKSSDINDVFNQWKINIVKRVEVVNTEPYILNLKNGLLDIRTNELLPFNSDFLSTIRINANFNPSAECPKFLKFLENTLEPGLIPVIQQLMGYCLTTFNQCQKCFVLFGVARSGKSTLIKLIEHIVGNENCCNIAMQDLGDRFNKAELYGKVLNAFSDLPSKVITDVGYFNCLVGTDMITAERKNKNPFSFRSFAKLLFSTNTMPQNIADRSDGFYRRLTIIRFLKQVSEDKVDTHLFEDLLKEADGILNWSLEGLRDLTNNKFIFPDVKETRDELQKYRYSSNSALGFVSMECSISPNYSSFRDDIYRAYGEFCYNNGFHTMSKPRFNKEVEEYYNGKITRSRDLATRKHMWKGIKYIGPDLERPYIGDLDEDDLPF
jgi:P4 family phage/plasmid primase-like protien